MKSNRIINSVKNVSVALFLHVGYILVSFLVRTFFILRLGNEYLSLNGLFTNIITLLSFAELGIGNAITFSLYKPLVDNDYEEISNLMLFYKRAYKFIRVVILMIGLCLIPLLPYFINGISSDINYITIYVLFLANTYCSYLFSYKKTLLIADEKNYIVLIAEKGLFFLQSLIQCFVLFVNNDYYLFLLIQIVGTLLSNISLTVYTNKTYTFLQKPHASSLSKSQINSLFINIKSICLYKFGAVILNGTDNLLISKLISTTYVGLYSNYSMIISAINGLLMQACNSLIGTIGQYNINNNGEAALRVFFELFLISFWIFGVSSICLSILISQFINLWVGSEYLLSPLVTIVIVFVFYVTGINQIPSLYRTSLGIFKEAKILPLVAAVINIVFSVILGMKFGLLGVFLATILAKVLTFNFFDPYIVFTKGFNTSPYSIFIKKVKYILILIANFIICKFVYSFLGFNGWTGFLINCIVVFMLSNLVMLVLLFNDDSFKTLFKRLLKTRGNNE